MLKEFKNIFVDLYEAIMEIVFDRWETVTDEMAVRQLGVSLDDVNEMVISGDLRVNSDNEIYQKSIYRILEENNRYYWSLTIVYLSGLALMARAALC